MAKSPARPLHGWYLGEQQRQLAFQGHIWQARVSLRGNGRHSIEPMLTLITATLNAARFIDLAIASAALQTGAIQHLVIDGGSTDDTLDRCLAHSAIEIVKAPGSSIYQAWNIGLARARGETVMFLNADDELGAKAAVEVTAAFARNPDADIVAGRATVTDVDRPDDAPIILTAAPSGALDVRALAFGVPAINAMAFRRRLFERHGGFDVAYRVAGDRAFLLRLAMQPIPPAVVRVDALLYRYRAHGGSLTLRPSLDRRLRIAREHIAVATALLASRPSDAVARTLWRWLLREATVGALHCLTAGQVASALGLGASALRAKTRSPRSS